jgi:hypothetical protein
LKYSFFLFLFSAFSLSADFDVKTKAELHWKYQNLVFDLQDYVLYGRIDKSFHLPKNWQGYLRLEIPFIWLWGNKTEFVAVDAEGIVDIEVEQPPMIPVTHPLKESGLADLLTRIFFTTPSLGKFTLGIGSDVTYPTAQEPDIGTGKYSARPMIGIKYDWPDLSSGAMTALFIKYQFSFAGDPNRPSFRILFLQPIFSCSFQEWAIGTSPEIQFNCKTKQWFIPMNFNFSKRFHNQIVLSAQYQRGLLTQFPVFQDEVEMTLTWLF